MSQIKSISLWQPYASYIIHGLKKYETRSWDASYCGLVAIHAAKRWTDEEQDIAESLSRKFSSIPKLQNPPLGAMLGICRLLSCERTESIRHNISAQEKAVGGWADGRWAWEMQVLEVFEQPIEAKGQQGLFNWDFPEGFLEKRIAIVGSRDYSDIEAVKRYVYSLPRDVTIVSGGARGVDTVAVETAQERGMRTVVIPVNQRGLPEGGLDRTNMFGQRAMQRNGEIVALCGSLIAFHDGSSAGTANSIERAQKAGKPVLINPTEKEAAPKQMKLTGFVSTYDEGAYITALEKGKHFSSEGEKSKRFDFQWEWPWLATKNDVWTKAQGGGYRLIPRDCPEAKAWGNILSGWMSYSETRNLREWLKSKADSLENFIALPCDAVDLNIYALDAALHAIKPEDIQHTAIPVEYLTFTQCPPLYNPGICLQYLEAGTVREFESGTLPMVYQFGDDERYFLANGTHRGIAWLVGLDPKRRAAMPVRLAHIPQSLHALQEQQIDVDIEAEDDMNFFAQVLLDAITIVQEGQKIYA